MCISDNVTKMKSENLNELTAEFSGDKTMVFILNLKWKQMFRKIINKWCGKQDL